MCLCVCECLRECIKNGTLGVSMLTGSDMIQEEKDASLPDRKIEREIDR